MAISFYVGTFGGEQLVLIRWRSQEAVVLSVFYGSGGLSRSRALVPRVARHIGPCRIESATQFLLDVIYWF